MECMRLRVQDIDFEINKIRVRNAKSNKDRLVPLPQSLLGHNDVSTTMVYPHVLRQGGQGVKSSLDMLE